MTKHVREPGLVPFEEEEEPVEEDADGKDADGKVNMPREVREAINSDWYVLQFFVFGSFADRLNTFSLTGNLPTPPCLPRLPRLHTRRIHFKDGSQRSI
jgi:hypothetical protein